MRGGIERGALPAIVVLAAAIRFAGLGDQSYWLDESFTVLVVDRDLSGMLDAIPEVESTPPLYYVLAWVWTQAFGVEEAGLRSLSAVFGTLTVPAAYLAARRLLSERAALVTALLVAVNPFLVWYSQEARAYALAILLATVSLHLAARAEQDRDPLSLAGWALAASAAVASHYFALFLVVVEAVWLLRTPVAARRTRAAVAAVAAVCVALVPLALEQRENGGASGFREAALGGRIADIPKEFLIGQFGGPVRGLGPLCAVLAAAALALLVARGSSEERRRALLPAAIAAGTVALALLAIPLGFDYFTPRHLAVAWVPAFLVVAAGMATERGRPAGIAVAAALAVAFAAVTLAVPFDDELQRDDWRAAARAIGDTREPRAIVMSPATGFVPLSLYEPGTAATPGPAFEISEIAVIAMTRSDDPRLPPGPPALGFRPLRVEAHASFAAARYVSDRPRRVTTRELTGARLTGEPTGVVYQP
jgi:4-amino-4-deoxy-L-arabinose transferase-like glycosyltransferase